MVDQDFSVQFFKGKTYLESRFGVIPNIPSRDFNPAGVFVHYIETVALLHATQNTNQDFIFANMTIKKGVLTLCETPVT